MRFTRAVAMPYDINSGLMMYYGTIYHMTQSHTPGGFTCSDNQVTVREAIPG